MHLLAGDSALSLHEFSQSWTDASKPSTLLTPICKRDAQPQHTLRHDLLHCGARSLVSGWHSSACGLQNLELPSEVDSPTRRLQEVDSFTPVSSTNDLVGMEQEVQVGQPSSHYGTV